MASCGGNQRGGDLPSNLKASGEPCPTPRFGGHDCEAARSPGGLGMRLRSTQSAVRVCDGGWQARGAFACRNGNDRASFGGKRDRLLPGGSCRGQSSGAPTEVAGFVLPSLDRSKGQRRNCTVARSAPHIIGGKEVASLRVQHEVPSRCQLKSVGEIFPLSRECKRACADTALMPALRTASTSLLMGRRLPE